MENKIKMFIGCNVPAYTCNFKCMYCYLGQHPETYEKGIIQLFASPEEIAHKFDINRIGGPCYFNMCGAGETLLHPQIIDLVIALSSNGHYTGADNFCWFLCLGKEKAYTFFVYAFVTSVVNNQDVL